EGRGAQRSRRRARRSRDGPRSPLPGGPERGRREAGGPNTTECRRHARVPARRPPTRLPRRSPPPFPSSSGEHILTPMAAFSLDQRRTLTLAATVLGSSLAFIDATVVFVALPTIAEDLDLGLTGQQWIVLSYSLSLASLYLVGGAIGDRYGRRPTFIAGAAGFAVASVFAGFAPTGSLLILARALQGVAGAFLTTNSLALLRGVYGDEAGRA